MALDILAVPEYLAGVLGIDSFTAGMLLSILILISSILTVGQITRDEKVLIITGVISVILCAGLTWVPVWIPILIVMTVAIMWGNTASRIMGG